MAIRLEHGELYDKAAVYSNESSEVGALIGRLDSLMSGLMEAWEGDAAVAFNAQYDDIKPSIIKLEELLADISGQLKKIADTMQETDQSIANTIGR